MSASVAPFDLTLGFGDDDPIERPAINGNNGESAFLRPEAASEVAGMIAANDGRTLTVSHFVAFGGYRIEEVFDLAGSAAAVQGVVDRCSRS